MRAAVGPLTIFQAGARRLVRAPILFVVLWLPALLATYASERTLSVNYIDIWTDAGTLDWPVLIVTPLWLTLSSFLVGGVLSRYARPERTGMAAFLADCRAFTGRMLRLTLLGVLVADLTYRYLDPALGSIHVEVATMVAFAMAFLAQLCIQLAAVRTITEDRRSVLFALAAGWRVFAARPLTVLLLYGLISLTMILWLLPVVWMLTIAGLNGAAPPQWVWNQLLMTAVLCFDLLASASLIALYQAEMVRLRPEYDPAMASSGLSGLNALTAKE